MPTEDEVRTLICNLENLVNVDGGIDQERQEQLLNLVQSLVEGRIQLHQMGEPKNEQRADQVKLLYDQGKQLKEIAAIMQINVNMAIMALVVAIFEIVCGSLIVLGLWTRLVVIPTIAIMLVATAVPRFRFSSNVVSGPWPTRPEPTGLCYWDHYFFSSSVRDVGQWIGNRQHVRESHRDYCHPCGLGSETTEHLRSLSCHQSNVQYRGKGFRIVRPKWDK